MKISPSLNFNPSRPIPGQVRDFVVVIYPTPGPVRDFDSFTLHALGGHGMCPGWQQTMQSGTR